LKVIQSKMGKSKRKLRIERKGYHRRAYTRKDGVQVKATDVPSTSFTIKDRGALGRGKKVIKVKKGLLGKVGYSTSASAESRHRALSEAVEKYGHSRVWRMLHAQTIFRKRLPDHAKSAFQADRDWVKETYGGPKPTREAIRKALRTKRRKGLIS